MTELKHRPKPPKRDQHPDEYRELKALMKEKGITLTELSRRTNISISSLSIKLAGQRAFFIEDALEIGEVLGIPEKKLPGYFQKKGA